MSIGLFDSVSLAAMATMLLVAMKHDAAHRRIPNQVVLLGSVTALGLSLSPHGIGLGSAIAGGMVGFIAFLALYLLGMLGAGDVKLAGAIGLFLGHPDMLWVNLLIMLFGGLLALVCAVYTRQLSRVLQWLISMLTLRRFQPQEPSMTDPVSIATGRTRMPYSLAIALGVSAHVAKQWSLF